MDDDQDSTITPDEPQLEELHEQLTAAISFMDRLDDRQQRAREIRFQVWEGQSEDNRIHEDALAGEKPFPWEGASDTRIYLADDVINEQVALLSLAFFRAEIHAMPTKFEDLPRATAVQKVLRWLRNVKLRAELVKQVELCAQYMLGDDPGVAIVGVHWRRREQMRMEKLDLAQIVAQLGTIEAQRGDGQAAQAAVTLADVIHNEERESEALQLLKQGFPTISDAKIRRALRELRATGQTELPKPQVVWNLPCIATYRLGDTIFLPEGTTDLQTADVIFTVERLTKVEARARVREEGWDKDVVEEVLNMSPGQRFRTNKIQTPSDSETQEPQVEERRWEFYCAWRRGSDESGVPWIFRTIWSPGSYGEDKDDAEAVLHEPLDYRDGLLPFHAFQREYLSDTVTDTRGVTRIAGAAGDQIKAQRDCRTDYTELATVPPVKKQMRRAGLKLVFGPAAEIPVDRGDDVSFLQPPQFPQASVEMERTVLNEVNGYFGRESETTPASKVELVRTKLAMQCAIGWAWLFQQMLYLCQQNMDKSLVYTVAGVDPELLDRSDIAGDYELQVAFDVRELNLEYLKERLGYFTTVLGMDAGGIIDRNLLVRLATRSLEPNLGDLLVRDESVATAKEAADEVDALSKLAIGIEVPPPEQANWQLRLRTIDETLMRSPKLQRQLQADPEFAKMVQARREAYVFQLQQQQNAVTGRTGFMPTQTSGALARAGGGQ